MNVLIWRLGGRGFCSEITTMLLAQLYCLDKGIDFALCSKHWNAAHDRGWQDYFLPFCEEIDGPETAGNYMFAAHSMRERFARVRKKLRFSYRIKRRVLFNYDIWPTIWNTDFASKRFALPSAQIHGDLYESCRPLLRQCWRLNPATAGAIDYSRHGLGFSEDSYFTLHVRRGDKSSEVSPIPLKAYLSTIRPIRGSLTTCFLMTDDFATVTALQRDCPRLNFITLAQPSDTGHVQGHFNDSPATARRERTLRLIAELEIAARGAFFVGTYSSNIARMVALMRGKETTIGVDGPFRLIGSG